MPEQHLCGEPIILHNWELRPPIHICSCTMVLRHDRYKTHHQPTTNPENLNTHCGRLQHQIIRMTKTHCAATDDNTIRSQGSSQRSFDHDKAASSFHCALNPNPKTPPSQFSFGSLCSIPERTIFVSLCAPSYSKRTLQTEGLSLQRESGAPVSCFNPCAS